MKTGIPTNGSMDQWGIPTHEEAVVYVKELDIFLTVKVLENRDISAVPVSNQHLSLIMYTWDALNVNAK